MPNEEAHQYAAQAYNHAGDATVELIQPNGAINAGTGAAGLGLVSLANALQMLALAIEAVADGQG